MGRLLFNGETIEGIRRNGVFDGMEYSIFSGYVPIGVWLNWLSTGALRPTKGSIEYGEIPKLTLTGLNRPKVYDYAGKIVEILTTSEPFKVDLDKHFFNYNHRAYATLVGHYELGTLRGGDLRRMMPIEIYDNLPPKERLRQVVKNNVHAPGNWRSDFLHSDEPMPRLLYRPIHSMLGEANLSPKFRAELSLRLSAIFTSAENVSNLTNNTFEISTQDIYDAKKLPVFKSVDGALDTELPESILDNRQRERFFRALEGPIFTFSVFEEGVMTDRVKKVIGKGKMGGVRHSVMTLCLSGDLNEDTLPKAMRNAKKHASKLCTWNSTFSSTPSVNGTAICNLIMRGKVAM